MKRVAIFETVKDAVGDQIPLIAGVGCASTIETVALAKKAPVRLQRLRSCPAPANCWSVIHFVWQSNWQKNPLRGSEKMLSLYCLTTYNMLADMQTNKSWHSRPA
jgi:Dihydrodipicolinate synthetase family